MFEKVGEWILLWRVLMHLWNKRPKYLSEKRNPGLWHTTGNQTKIRKNNCWLTGSYVGFNRNIPNSAEKRKNNKMELYCNASVEFLKLNVKPDLMISTKI